jgi:hypothetical protein
MIIVNHRIGGSLYYIQKARLCRPNLGIENEHTLSVPALEAEWYGSISDMPSASRPLVILESNELKEQRLLALIGAVELSDRTETGRDGVLILCTRSNNASRS